MRNVIREVKTKKLRPLWQMSLLFLSGVVGTNFLITSCNLLGPKYAGIASVLVLIIAISAGAFAVVKLLCQFVYTLDDDKLVFDKAIGNKRVTILKLKLNEIEMIAPYKTKKQDKTVTSTYNLVCDKICGTCYVGEFYRDGKKHRFIFEPSKDLLKAIISAVEPETVQI